MIPLTLAEIRELCPGRLEPARGEPYSAVSGVTIDSRRVQPGHLFVVVGGGGEFAASALERGAAAVLYPDDAFEAMAVLGKAVRTRSRAQFVGITGSTGKTSTKDILGALCRPHAPTIAAEASYNAELGVPLTLCRVEPDTAICVLELAMRGFGQIAELCRIAEPTLGVITNVAPVHLEFVGSVAGVAKAKAELIAALPAGATAVVPAHAPELQPLLDRPDLDVVTFGPDGDLRLEGLEVADGTSRLEIRAGEARVQLTVALPQRYQAHNVLAAVAAYRALGLPLDGLAAGAGDVTLSRWRGEEVELPGGITLINDCYNANPVSMRAALEHLVERAAGRRTVAILGEMAELGPASREYHREAGALAARLGVDVILAVGGEAKQCLFGARGVSRGVVTRSAGNARAAGQVAWELLEPGDCVLLKGSRAVGLEAVVDTLSLIRT